MYIMLDIDKRSSFKAPMDGLRITLMERCQYIRVRYAHYSRLYQSDLTVTGTDDQSHGAALQICRTLIDGPVRLEFKDFVKWDIEALSTDFAKWMTDDNDAETISRVGVLSSRKCQSVLQAHLSEALCTDLRQLVKTASLSVNLRVFFCVFGWLWDIWHCL